MRKKTSIFEIEGLTDDQKRRIAERLREIRKSRKISQEKLGVNRETVEKWENIYEPNSLPSLDNLVKMSKIFDFKISDLIDERITEEIIEKELGFGKEAQDCLRAYVRQNKFDEIELLEKIVSSNMLPELSILYNVYRGFLMEYREYIDNGGNKNEKKAKFLLSEIRVHRYAMLSIAIDYLASEEEGRREGFWTSALAEISVSHRYGL